MLLILCSTLMVAVCTAASASYNGNGVFSYYNDAGYGACGEQINAATGGEFVAVSKSYWTTANPNNDPVCQQCVEVTYNGKTFTWPVKDKCPSCGPEKVDLSQQAFASLDNLDLGIIKGSWSFVEC